MGAIYIIEGLLIYMYAYDHNPPHIHVRSGSENFTIGIIDRIIEGKAKSKSVKKINDFLDKHQAQVMDLWERAQKGESIEKINR